MVALWRAGRDLVFGILLVTLVVLLLTGAVLALVLLRRQATLAKLQLDFVSKVSHELRTPLTSIRMFAEMLRGDQARDAEHTRVCLDVLDKETGRLTERIERLLDWGRMEAGRKTYRLRPENVADVVNDAEATFRRSILGKPRSLQVEMGTALPTILADRDALVDALLNLLTNADKYSAASAPIRLCAIADARMVRLSVVDRGIGIPRREHRRIFEKFYRVDERLSRDVEGSGLGLAIVRHIAVGHSGRVEVQSEPGQGSTFTLVLPRATTAELDSAGRPSSPSRTDSPEDLPSPQEQP
jgi:two-component system, OmpR family, phosphate regulon sensor histidine kinase PhoR